MEQSEEELARFRREWQAEVTAKAQSKPAASASRKAHGASRTVGRHQETAGQSSKIRQPVASISSHILNSQDGADESGSNAFHDLEERETGRRVDDDSKKAQALSKEPQTALEHYEKAVEKEGIGNLGDSVNLYRKAFKLDDKVHEKYKNKHFPPSAFAKKSATSQIKSNDSSSKDTVRDAPSHMRQASIEALPPTVAELLSDFSRVSISRAPPPTEFSPLPPCPIAELPEEVLFDILQQVAITDIAAFSRLSRVCKRFAYLTMSEDRIWRRISLGHEFGLGAMHYQFGTDLMGKPLSESALEGGGYTLDSATGQDSDEDISSIHLPLTPTYPSYRAMFRLRPRIRFSGCYISTVNYNRPGGNNASSFTWSTPILIVTYYRYLRFFRDGTCVSLLTTAEPADVVPWIWKEYAHSKHTGNLPQAVMRDALRGRWRLSGDPYKAEKKRLRLANALDSAGNDDLGSESSIVEQAKNIEVIEPEEMEELEGDVIIETEGVVPKYIYKMHLGLASAGKGARNNKLNWKGYWNQNKLTDDWGEFGLKNDRPFYWSRVKSYGNGWSKAPLTKTSG